MTYDLDVLAGDADADEVTWRPLDAGAARAVLSSLAGARVDDDEVSWELDGAAVTFVLVPDDGVLRSIGVTITDAVDAGARPRDARRIVDVVLDLADRLGARVHDPQLGVTVTRADVDDVVEGFAGR